MSESLQQLRKRGRPAGPEPLCTVAEVAAAFAVPLQTVYGWTRQRSADGLPVLPTRKLGRMVRVRVRDLEKLDERLASRPAASDSAAVSFFCGGNAANE
jgi:transposase